MMKNKFKKALQAAVILSCATLFPWQAMAAEVEEVEYEVYEQTFKYDGKTYFKAEIVDVGQKTEDGTTRDIEDEEFDAIQEQAIAYLGDITGAPVNAYPIINLTPLDIKDANASAESEAYKKTRLTKYASYFIGDGITDNNGEAAADVTVNLAHEGSSWYTKKYPILPVNGIDADYAGTIVHEMVHAMGAGCFDLLEDEDTGKVAGIDLSNHLKYTAGLYDAFGRNVSKIKKDKYKCISITAITKEEYDDLKNDNKPIPKNTFYIIKDDTVESYGGVYFSGTNVLKVLNGAEIVWPNGIALDAVPGIPIECYEGEELDLSHLELQNGLMSHQNYRNWCTLMEAELAVLQDIGFEDIEREKFFGHSIYESGTTAAVNTITISGLANGNGKSWSSDTDRAIGLHIYGSDNEVTLGTGANITATGSYSMGVRVDGVGNKLTISSDVQVGSDGSTTSEPTTNEPTEDSYGISVNYGNGHKITIDTNASVIAKGNGSIGAIFDFGSNEMGDRVEYRGSYIRGEYDKEQGKFVNLEFTEDGALEGALVDTFNVNGTLSGEKAIYISPNALVKTINIASTATVTGDIISEWNPEGVEYFYTRNYNGENPYKGLLPDLPSTENGMTNLNFENPVSDSNTNGRIFTDNIIGPYSISLNVLNGTLNTRIKGDAQDNTKKFTYINANNINIHNGATLNANNLLMAENGYGEININTGGSLTLEKYPQAATSDAEIISRGTILIAFNDEDGDGNITSGIINNVGTVDFSKGELALKPDAGYYDNTTKIQIMSESKGVSGETFSDIWLVNMNGNAAVEVQDTTLSRATSDEAFKVTNTLTMTAEQSTDNQFINLITVRSFDNVELDEEEEDVSEIIEKVDDTLASTERDKEWKDMIGAIDFLKTDEEINNALGQLLPSAYGYGAMATMDLHRMLSDFAVGGSLAPATNVKEKGKWHNIVISYDSETDHIKNGTGYKNNHSGMVGAMERTLDDVTVGWHAALNHQSTNGAEIGRLKGDGLYLGAQVKYAPKDWNGWSTFSIARVGIEDFEMQRNFNFNGYNSKVDSDFTAFSGSLRVGGAYEKEAKAMTYGPFAALDYAFAHHPSIEEDGTGAGRLSVESGTYDSLRTQLGYRVQTAPKHFKNETYWQANAAIAWNHELLGDAGNVSASFRDFGGTTFGCDVDNYGRDSLSLMAGMTLKTPKKLDVTFNLGTDIYRHGGDTLYAKCALEWKF